MGHFEGRCGSTSMKLYLGFEALFDIGLKGFRGPLGNLKEARLLAILVFWSI
jgi:hypothetical protein